MKPRTVAVAAVAFALGVISQLVASLLISLSINQDEDTGQHWKLVNDYNAYTGNPDNYSIYRDGLYGVEDPYDPMPSLAALVSAGELEHVDIVLPSVPANRETNRLWMKFVIERRETIVFATGNPEYVDYEPAGESPLHLQLWFKASGKADVQQLIKELETLAALGDN
jgi:hypothetical protein